MNKEQDFSYENNQGHKKADFRCRLVLCMNAQEYMLACAFVCECACAMYLEAAGRANVEQKGISVANRPSGLDCNSYTTDQLGIRITQQYTSA